MTVISTAKWVSAVGGAALVSWTLAGKLDTALVEHLDAKFATKEDVGRVEKKVDRIQFLLEESNQVPARRVGLERRTK